MRRLLLPVLILVAVILLLVLGGCENATTATSASTTRCLKTASPIARTGFLIISDVGVPTVYDFDSAVQASSWTSMSEVRTGFGPTHVRCGGPLAVRTGEKCDTVYVSIDLAFRGAGTGTFEWEEGAGSASGPTVTITGGPHGGTYTPISGASDVRQFQMGPAGAGHDIVEASFCGSLRGTNGAKLTVRGGRLRLE